MDAIHNEIELFTHIILICMSTDKVVIGCVTQAIISFTVYEILMNDHSCKVKETIMMNISCTRQQ